MLNRRVLSYPLLGPGRLGPARVFFDFKAAPAVEGAYELSGPDGIANSVMVISWLRITGMGACS